ncbi:HAD-IC family P-type ATPase [Flavihumibacter sp. CACIAM 22H1]|uniref:HAD-IC family P-type ATPase n=1 Tax=Flavihumibacter sp. CACIAM 22H1 TaxID=1812911 RepID=UPI000B0547FF|nr:HAD-IC family P-type ATPase [Flavihumibacter sp. CACIAM 22H1]
MSAKEENSFWQYDAAYWFRQLNSSPNGLTNQQAAAALLAQGNHSLKQTRFKKYLLVFLGQFKSPLMLLLIGAVLLSAVLGDRSDVAIILFIVLSTGLLSFLQEKNAGEVVEKLQSLISIKSTVLREGREEEIIASRIVPGDLLLLNAGDLLPADCLLLASEELYANESSLTGESFPTRKEPGVLDAATELASRSNCLWEGTNIISGTGRALVIQTGDATLFGHIARSSTRTIETKFEKGIRDFGFFLMKITLLLAIFILVINLLNHKGIVESVLFALALAVGMAPELLPAITTIAMSAGAKRLLAKKVIVKKLNSIQNLGEVNLLCTDKTGTITEGRIDIAGMVDGMGKESVLVKQLAFWNASLEAGYSNPIDEALKKMPGILLGSVEKIGEVPYDFIRKRVSVAIRTDKDLLLITKGACTEMLDTCAAIRLEDGRELPIDPYLDSLKKSIQEFGRDGLRAIAVGYKKISSAEISKELESAMVFAGFICMKDPVKSRHCSYHPRIKRVESGFENYNRR